MRRALAVAFISLVLLSFAPAGNAKAGITKIDFDSTARTPAPASRVACSTVRKDAPGT